MTGLPALRVQVAAKIARSYGVNVDADTEVTITPGATQAIFCAIQAVIHAGDEVIVFDPCYDSYEPSVELAGGVVFTCSWGWMIFRSIGKSSKRH